jgi:hypothetical protein
LENQYNFEAGAWKVLDNRQLLTHEQIYIGVSLFLVTPFLACIHHRFTGTHLVVEQTNALLNKGDAKLLSRLKDCRIVLTTTRCSNVLGP